MLSELIYSIPALLIALTIHEFAHGYVSYQLGDPTPKEDGRLSLNPFRHLDPLGTLSLFLFKFGWAKPVQVNPYYYKNQKRDMVSVALAGPMSNFILAFLSIFCYYGCLKLVLSYDIILNNFTFSIIDYLMNFFSYLMSYNLGLAIFNLIPLPPLDGSKLLNALLPDEFYFNFMRYERYFTPLIFILLFSGLLDTPLSLINQAIFDFMSNISLFIFNL